MLFIPGPTDPDPRVLSALSLPVLPHYGNEWKALYEDTTSKLQKVFRTKNDVVLVPVPGELALEMAVANFVPKGGKVFVCANGFFGDVLIEIVRMRGGKPIVIRSKRLGSAIEVANVKKAIEDPKNAGAKCLFIFHNETSTGVVNPVRTILEVCHKAGIVSVLDSVSAFGGMDIRVDEWHAGLCIGYSSKALGGIFGAVPLSVSPQAWELASKNKDKIESRYLNFNMWKKYIETWGSWGHPHPSSMPTSVIVALNKAVTLSLEEGLDNRYRRHREAAKMIREGLVSLGLEIFPDKDCLSNTVSVAKVNPELEKELRRRLMEEYKIMIGGGLEELGGKIIRIGHMGRSATFPYVSTILAALRVLLTDLEKRGFSLSSR